MGELMNRSLLVEGYVNIDADSRTLLLLEAADFDAFSELKIERNFFTFTKNAAYLFRFFEELSGELVEIDALDRADTYGDYAEHIEILKLLRSRYRALCMQNRILDRIFLPELYRLNSAWIERLGKLEIVAEGYLTNFELSVLKEIAAMIPVELLFDVTPYNLKMQEKLAAFGVDFKRGNCYRIDLSGGRVVEATAKESLKAITATPISERMLQAAFIKQKVFEMVNEGIAPEQIAVVLPDEGFASFLRPFDSEDNFNFAMGLSYEHTVFVRRAKALLRYAEHAGVENRMRLQRLFPAGLDIVGQEMSRTCDKKSFASLIDSLLEEEEETVAEGIKEERFYFERLLPRLGDAPLRTLLHLFVNRLSARSIDDVRGGKITVMGVLETRACRFEGVIIVDFNEAYVPHKSDKDLFINSSVRGRAGLPTTGEREALQKQFYYQLVSRAQRVEVSYVTGESVLPSRFLRELDIGSKKEYADEAWGGILYAPSPKRTLEPQHIEGEYDFTAGPLSATALKTFLTCRRRFYYRYVEGIKEHRLPKEMPEEYEIGNALHEALRDVFSLHGAYTDAKVLKAEMAQALARHRGDSPLERFLEGFWLKRMEPFFTREVQRFEAVRVAACEQQYSMKYGGMILEGRIDRIDEGPDGLEVLDYKSGNYPLYTAKSVENATDFQLEFYALLAGGLGKVAYSGYYDLNSGEIIREPFQLRKRELLKEHLEMLASNRHYVFDMTEDHTACRYCAYAYLCRREPT